MVVSDQQGSGLLRPALEALAARAKEAGAKLVVINVVNPALLRVCTELGIDTADMEPPQ